MVLAMDLDLVLLISTFFLVTSWKKRQDEKDLPPGPPGLPVLGHLPFLGSKPHLTLAKWREKYGDLIYCRFGSFPTIVINDPKIAKQVFNLQETAGRAHIQAYVEGTDNLKGMILGEGPGHLEQRQFALKNLKDFGMGRKTIQAAICEDLLELLDKVGKTRGQPVENKQLFNVHVLNSLWTIVMGQRMDQNKLDYFASLTRDKLNNLGSIWCQMAFFMPWLENWVKTLTFGRFSFIQEKIDGFKELYAFMGREVQEIKRSWDPGQPRHLTDAWLDKMKETDDPGSSFHEKNSWAAHFTGDLFFGAVETTSTSLEWLLNYMARNPRAQKRLQKEIDHVTGGTRALSLDDRPQMPYADAILYELLRISSAVALGLHHRAITDFRFKGYRFPKGTMILANLHGIHHDPGVFGDPERFRPERWLGDGANKLKSGHFLPFSSGKRSCVGEIMARQQLFLYIVSIFQKFTVEFEDVPPPLDSIVSIVLLPTPFKICFRPRTAD